VALVHRYPLSARARELFMEYRWASPQHELSPPEPGHCAGERYLGAFEETLESLTNWLSSDA
jgi:hypothetical protein